jgi:hypothetical protein
LTVKGALEELGRTVSSRAQDREGHLGEFPFSATLPVIPEEDEDSQDNSSSTRIASDLPDEEHRVPEEFDTDHDSEGNTFLDGAPNYDEEVENRDDQEEPTMAMTASSGNKYHTSASKKNANQLNGLISKVRIQITP